MLSKRALFVVSALLPGCFSNTVALEPEATNVKIVHESERPLRCEFLGKINGESRSSDEKGARAGAENDFRNHAADLKGNFALVEAERGGHVGTSSQRDFFIGGKALRCETEASEEAQEKAEEKVRAQKEQEQADREQKEAEEHPSAKENGKNKRKNKNKDKDKDKDSK